MTGPPNDERPAPSSSRDADASPSNINLTPGKLPEIVSAVNTVASEIAVIVSAADQKDCGHATIDECVRADLDAMLGRNPGKTEYEKPPEARILKRTDCKDGSTVLRLPVRGPDRGAYHELVVFGGCGKPWVKALLRLWKRRLLPFYVLIVNATPTCLQLACDAPCLETLAKYQARLNAIAWSFPWPLHATALSSDVVILSDEAGLGLRHQDDASRGAI